MVKGVRAIIGKHKNVLETRSLQATLDSRLKEIRELLQDTDPALGEVILNHLKQNAYDQGKLLGGMTSLFDPHPLCRCTACHIEIASEIIKLLRANQVVFGNLARITEVNFTSTEPPSPEMVKALTSAPPPPSLVELQHFV
jgi:hypothetical protein